MEILSDTMWVFCTSQRWEGEKQNQACRWILIYSFLQQVEMLTFSSREKKLKQTLKERKTWIICRVANRLWRHEQCWANGQPGEVQKVFCSWVSQAQALPLPALGWAHRAVLGKPQAVQLSPSVKSLNPVCSPLGACTWFLLDLSWDQPGFANTGAHLPALLPACLEIMSSFVSGDFIVLARSFSFFLNTL